MSEVDKLYFKTYGDISTDTFDYIVIGGGAYGTSFTHRMLERKPDAKILVLEKGNYLIPDHIQNIPPTYVKLNTEAGTRPWQYSGTPDLNFMPQIPFVGGRALFWNAWTPQPDITEMPGWPAASVERLRGQWYATGEFMGRRYSLETPGNQNQQLASCMRDRVFAGLKDIEGATPQGDPDALNSAMATGQGVSKDQWAKFSPIPVLVADVQAFPDNLSVVVNAEVNRLIADADKVVTIETADGDIAVGDAQVIMACNTLEAGFILSRSFPDEPLIGKNLCGHIRSWLAARVPASSVPALTGELQAIALYMPGQDPVTKRLMHTHISVVHNPHPEASYDTLYKILPDASTPQAVKTYQDPEYVVIMLHSMGEFLGERSADSWNYVGVNCDNEAVVHVEMKPEDAEFWKQMDRTTFQVLDVLAGDAPVEYQHNLPDGTFDWKAIPPDSIHNKGLVHEAGTLWMGDSSQTSVTNSSGQMHNYTNVFGLGSMLFPRPGSWNPTLTGVAQAFALVDSFTR